MDIEKIIEELEKMRTDEAIMLSLRLKQEIRQQKMGLISLSDLRQFSEKAETELMRMKKDFASKYGEVRESIFLPYGTHGMSVRQMIDFRYALEILDMLPPENNLKLYQDWMLSLSELARAIKREVLGDEILKMVSDKK